MNANIGCSQMRPQFENDNYHGRSGHRSQYESKQQMRPQFENENENENSYHKKLRHRSQYESEYDDRPEHKSEYDDRPERSDRSQYESEYNDKPERNDRPKHKSEYDKNYYVNHTDLIKEAVHVNDNINPYYYIIKRTRARLTPIYEKFKEFPRNNIEEVNIIKDIKFIHINIEEKI